MQNLFKTSSKTFLKPLPRPLQNLSRNLSKTSPKTSPNRDLKNLSLLFYIYIYNILEQPGLTLEREAPFNCRAKVSLKQAKQTKQSNHTQF